MLAAGVAQALGRDALAVTSSMPVEAPAEIAAVLDEVGMKAPEGAVTTLDAIDRGAGDVVFLGTSPPASLAGEPVWNVALFQGSGELERLATARIARDRIERYLERMRRLA